jgi:hypothetical protein
MLLVHTRFPHVPDGMEPQGRSTRHLTLALDPDVVN